MQGQFVYPLTQKVIQQLLKYFCLHTKMSVSCLAASINNSMYSYTLSNIYF